MVRKAGRRMRIVGIDTAGPVASAALVEDGKLIVEQRSGGQTGKSYVCSAVSRANHAESVLPLIDSVLERAGCSLSDLSGFAVSIGPGSFTGLRVGLSTVKGLAYGWEIPVVGVSTLLANAARITKWDGLICSFVDAKKKEVYAALLQKKNDIIKRLSDDFVTVPERVIEMVRRMNNGTSWLFIGDGIKPYGDLLSESLGKSVCLTLGESYPSVASAVARLGEEKLRRNESEFLGSLTPLYLRPSEAELRRINSGLSD
jgi:tRNA threonylcarbamoyladenosine biosynthesis protein TsaB